MSKIAVIETGPVVETLQAKYGTYPDMFRNLLGGADPSIETSAVSLINDEPLPDPAAYDGYLITGSRYGVYEDHAWIPPLKQFVRDVAAADRAMIGICFGHQIMTEAHGGRVEKSAKGWGLGQHTYNLVAKPWMTDALPAIDVLALHQDQVVEPPKDVELIAGWDFCEYGGFQFGPKAISFQFHPEFSPDFFRDLIASRRGTIIPEEIADKGVETVRDSNDSGLVARWLTTFVNDN